MDVDPQVAGDAKHPTAKASAGEIVPCLLVDTEKRLLCEVFGEVAVAGVAEKEADERSLVARNQFVEGEGFAVLDAGHQEVVIGH